MISNGGLTYENYRARTDSFFLLIGFAVAFLYCGSSSLASHSKETHPSRCRREHRGLLEVWECDSDNHKGDIEMIDDIERVEGKLRDILTRIEDLKTTDLEDLMDMVSDLNGDVQDAIWQVESIKSEVKELIGDEDDN